MEKGLIAIGKMAKINNTTVPTLRLYDRLGLLKPLIVDDESGYRYYSIEQNSRLDLIQYMKELGLSLKEISDVLISEDLTLIETLLSRKNEQIHSQLRSLRLQHDAVERTILSIERYRKSPLTGTLALEYIDQRYIYSIPCRENFYDSDIKSYERSLTELRATMIELDIPYIHTYNVGTSIKKEHFEKCELIADKIFIFADKNLKEMDVEMKIIESGMYATIYIDDYDKEAESAKKLLDFCRDNSFNIAGDYICEVLTEFNVFQNHQRSMFMRLQVPLNFSLKEI